MCITQFSIGINDRVEDLLEPRAIIRVVLHT